MQIRFLITVPWGRVHILNKILFCFLPFVLSLLSDFIRRPWHIDFVVFSSWWSNSRIALSNNLSIPSSRITCLYCPCIFYTLRPRQNFRHFADEIFKWSFLNEIVWISLKMSRIVVPKFRINNSSSDQIKTWRRPGTITSSFLKVSNPLSLSEQMMVGLLTHTCVTRYQRVNMINRFDMFNHIFKCKCMGMVCIYKYYALFSVDNLSVCGGCRSYDILNFEPRTLKWIVFHIPIAYQCCI